MTQHKADPKKLGTVLTVKWGVSRGRDTYGYTLCSLYADGTKVAACNGGGYDMRGTVIGNWIARAFREELRTKIDREFYGLRFVDPNYDPGKATVPGTDKTVEEREQAGDSLGLERLQAAYAQMSPLPTERHTVPYLDGACGEESMLAVLRYLGYDLKRLKVGGRRSDGPDVYEVVEHVPYDPSK